METRKIVVGRKKAGKCGKCNMHKDGDKLNNVIIERDNGNDSIYAICKSCIGREKRK